MTNYILLHLIDTLINATKENTLKWEADVNTSTSYVAQWEGMKLVILYVQHEDRCVLCVASEKNNTTISTHGVPKGGMITSKLIEIYELAYLQQLNSVLSVVMAKPAACD